MESGVGPAREDGAGHVNYDVRLKVARLLFLLHDKRLRQQYCACRRPVEDFIDSTIIAAMDEVERALASE